MINGFGFAPSKTNFIKPGKKPMSSMSPMVIYDSITGKVRIFSFIFDTKYKCNYVTINENLHDNFFIKNF